MVRKIAVTLVGLVALAVLVVVGLALTKPRELYVERHLEVAATPAAVYALINDLHRFTEWSPWQKLDPAMTSRYAGPGSGIGASYSWTGNRSVGAGRLTITDTQPGASVGMRLEFLEPFAATNQVQFSLDPVESGTRITWAMTGRNDFMTRVGSVFIDMEAMIGRDFETGLASLKALSEGG